MGLEGRTHSPWQGPPTACKLGMQVIAGCIGRPSASMSVVRQGVQLRLFFLTLHFTSRPFLAWLLRGMHWRMHWRRATWSGVGVHPFGLRGRRERKQALYATISGVDLIGGRDGR